MISLFSRTRYSPIGIDIGSRSVKLVQFNADYSRLIDATRVDLSGEAEAEQARDNQPDRTAEVIRQAREGRDFRGKDAVLCLNDRHLFLQNIRVPQGDKSSLDRTVQQEAAGRIPFPIAEAEIRYIEAADIRHGDQIMRELILIACHRPVLEELLALVEKAGLRPVAVDIEPAALLRSYDVQFRRDEDRLVRSMLVHVGNGGTLVVIFQGQDILFVKYIELGGKHFDEAVARSLKMSVADATALRRNNGDRRSDRQDPEIARSIHEATRSVIDRLLGEMAMCVRYHSVTFRGQPLERMVLGEGKRPHNCWKSLRNVWV